MSSLIILRKIAKLQNSAFIRRLLCHVQLTKDEKPSKPVAFSRNIRILYFLRQYAKYLNLECGWLPKHWFEIFQNSPTLFAKAAVLEANSKSDEVINSMSSMTEISDLRDNNAAEVQKKEERFKLPLSKGSDKNFQGRTPKWRNVSLAFVSCIILGG